MRVSAELRRLVIERAEGRCEYCRMHQLLQGATFHVEHIVPSRLGGLSSPDNLAHACPGCNFHKADRVTAIDPQSADQVPLFDPRKEAWTSHFGWRGYEVIGLTATGRATIAALNLNQSRRLTIREAEELFGLFQQAS